MHTTLEMHLTFRLTCVGMHTPLKGQVSSGSECVWAAMSAGWEPRFVQIRVVSFTRLRVYATSKHLAQVNHSSCSSVPSQGG